MQMHNFLNFQPSLIRRGPKCNNNCVHHVISLGISQIPPPNARNSSSGKSCRKHITSYWFKIPYIRLVLTLSEFYIFPRVSLTLQGLLNIKMQLKLYVFFLCCQTFQYIASILHFLQWPRNKPFFHISRSSFISFSGELYLGLLVQKSLVILTSFISNWWPINSLYPHR